MGSIATDQQLKFIYLGAGNTLDSIQNKKDSDIIFYSDENKIIVNGIEFGLTSQQKSDLTAAYDGLFAEGGIQSRVGSLEKKVGSNAKITSALFQIVEDLKGKLDGGSFETGGAQGATINVGDESITNAVAAINKLYELVSNAESHAGVQSVNGLQGVVVLTGSNISTTDAAGNTFKGKTIDQAFAGIQSNIDGIQARIGAEETERQKSVTGIQARITAEETLRGQQISGVQTQLYEKIGNIGTQSVKEYVDNAAEATLAGAQASAKAYVDDLAGFDWTKSAQTVQGIIDELQDTGYQGLETMVDKIRDNFNYGPEGAQSTSVKGYIDGVVANANSGAQGYAGTAETNAKNYADTQITAGIQALDSTKDNKDTHVYVQVEQEDGKLKGVQVNSIDIASATALTNVENQLKWVVV